MSDVLQAAHDLLHDHIGNQQPATDWFTVTQDQIDQFADVTMDHQWIHVDTDRAKDGPFGTTIAHGHLTLSIMGHLPSRPAGASTQDTGLPKLEGQKMGINYGFDRVRFPSPVKVGSRVRAHRTLKRVEIKGGMIEAMHEVVVEIDGQDKPACVAESVSRMVF
ncbi:MAG: MaoC family dehydratase [Acidobacteriota bacterium]|nr:MaoC family dehydratase [Acidobacteriota bacterium]